MAEEDTTITARLNAVVNWGEGLDEAEERALLSDALAAIERLTVEAQEADQKAMRYRLALLDARAWLAGLGSTAKADHLKGILLES